MLATTTRKGEGERRALLSGTAAGRNRFSLARLACALSHGVRPLSEDFTRSALPLRVHKFMCTSFVLLCSDIAHDSYRVSIWHQQRFLGLLARQLHGALRSTGRQPSEPPTRNRLPRDARPRQELAAPGPASFSYSMTCTAQTIAAARASAVQRP